MRSTNLLSRLARFCSILCAAVAATLLLGWTATANGFEGWPEVAPESVGVDASIIERIDAEALEGIKSGQMPGCVVAVGLRGKTILLKAYGERQVLPESVAMTTDTVFDLASLTKPIATATSVMILADQGKLSVSDRVAKHIPEFAEAGKEEITIKQLFLHQSGLIPDNPLADYQHGVDVAWEKIWHLKPRSKPGAKFDYSDVNFLVLGKLVERVSGEPLNNFALDQIFKPLGMHETGYLPSEELRQRSAPTEKRDGHWLQGEVHDPRAALLGGVAGHAGLFSTAHDLSLFAAAMIDLANADDQPPRERLVDAETFRQFTTSHDVGKNQLRGLGWDMQSGFSSNRGKGMSQSAFGHGGFTGTTLWIDPELQLFVIFLSNRLHPDGKGAVNQLAGRIGTIAVETARAAK